MCPENRNCRLSFITIVIVEDQISSNLRTFNFKSAMSRCVTSFVLGLFRPSRVTLWRSVAPNQWYDDGGWLITGRHPLWTRWKCRLMNLCGCCTMVPRLGNVGPRVTASLWHIAHTVKCFKALSLPPPFNLNWYYLISVLYIYFMRFKNACCLAHFVGNRKTTQRSAPTNKAEMPSPRCRENDLISIKNQQ